MIEDETKTHRNSKINKHVIEEINKKIKPLSNKHKFAFSPLFQYKQAKSMDKKPIKKEAQLRNSNNFSHRNIPSTSEHEKNFYVLQKKVQEHIIVRKLDIVAKAFSKDEKQNEPLVNYFDMFQSEENSQLKEIQYEKEVLQKKMEKTRMKKLQRRLKSLIKTDILREYYKSGERSKLKLAINHKKLISMK